MRIKKKQRKKQPKEGATRVKSGFLWLPKYIKGEWRWLETATWKQVRMRRWYAVPDVPSHERMQTYLKWVNINWVKNA